MTVGKVETCLHSTPRNQFKQVHFVHKKTENRRDDKTFLYQSENCHFEGKRVSQGYFNHQYFRHRHTTKNTTIYCSIRESSEYGDLYGDGSVKSTINCRKQYAERKHSSTTSTISRCKLNPKTTRANYQQSSR